ncbi:MAG: hypothetical protein ACRC90_08940, partial [Lactococcus garvieae]
NVVTPAITSVLTFVLFPFKSKIFSNITLFLQDFSKNKKETSFEVSRRTVTISHTTLKKSVDVLLQYSLRSRPI